MVVGYLKNTQITKGKKPCVLGEASTQIPSDKKAHADQICCYLLDVSSVQLKSPITKMK